MCPASRGPAPRPPITSQEPMTSRCPHAVRAHAGAGKSRCPSTRRTGSAPALHLHPPHSPSSCRPSREPRQCRAASVGTDAQTHQSCPRPGTDVAKVAPDGFVCLSSPALDSGFTANISFSSSALLRAVAHGLVGRGVGVTGCSPLVLRSCPAWQALDSWQMCQRRARGCGPGGRGARWCHARHPQGTSQLSLLCRSPCLWALSPRHAFPESKTLSSSP